MSVDSDTGRKAAAVALLVIAVGLLIILATSISQMELTSGQALPDLFRDFDSNPIGGSQISDGLSRFDWLARLIGTIFLVLLPVAVVYVIFNPRALRRVLRQLLWMLVLVMMVFALAKSNLARPVEEDSALLSGVEEAPVLPSLGLPTTAPAWLEYATSLTIAALIMGGGWFFWQRWQAARSPLGLVAAQACDALEDLHSGADLKDTVLRCYVQMVGVFDRNHGLARTQAMTAREFERTLAAAGVTDDHVRRLTRLFESVRYGAHRPDAAARQEARDCLQAIVDSYGTVS
ncbi:MAG: DUF4129 domain-containing protein [Anaerolineales bacterium]